MPRTNGKVERLIQALLREWGYRFSYESFAERQERRARLQADERWRGFLGRIQPLIHTQHNRILVPTAFSPIR